MKDNFKDIVDIQFTADMEEKLDGVEEGATNSKAILRNFYRGV